VAGALLLLAEAFPNASAYDLKYALYMTAIDLGEPGEDNIYGRGLIDVEAAFYYLEDVLGYTHTPPITNEYDLATTIIYPQKPYQCYDAEEKIDFYFKNIGQEALTGFDITIILNDSISFTTSHSATLNHGDSIILSTSEMSFIPHFNVGQNRVTVIVKPQQIVQEFDVFNNGSTTKFHIYDHEDFPLYQSFEDINTLTELNWVLKNPDNSKTWSIMKWGKNNEHNALAMNYKTYSNSQGELDFLTIPTISLPNDTDSLFVLLTFAYKEYGSNSLRYDSLFIEISNDCEETYTYIFKEGAIGLATVPKTPGIYVDFIPKSIDEFKDTIIFINNFKGQDVTLRLTTKTGGGSHLYIHRFSVRNTRVVGVSSENINNITVYPNPVQDQLSINCQSSINKVEIVDMMGKTVSLPVTSTNNSQLSTVNCQLLKPGVYFVKIENQYIKFIKL
jgi:hypothetical protein